jgi:hypothetical protein
LIIVLVKFKVLKRAHEQESLMSCHQLIDVTVADWGDEYMCQELADIAKQTHFSFNFFLILFRLVYLIKKKKKGNFQIFIKRKMSGYCHVSKFLTRVHITPVSNSHVNKMMTLHQRFLLIGSFQNF